MSEYDQLRKAVGDLQKKGIAPASSAAVESVEPVQLAEKEEPAASSPDASQTASETPEPKQRLSLDEMKQQASGALERTMSKATAALEAKGQQAVQAFAAGRENATEALKNLKEGAESVVAVLKARVMEELKTEKEGTEYNLVLAKIMAEDAAVNLVEKMKKVEPLSAVTAVLLGLNALLYGGSVALKVESLIPAGGNMVHGLKAYLDGLNTMTAGAPITAAIFTGLSLGVAKFALADAMRNNKPDQEESKT